MSEFDDILGVEEAAALLRAEASTIMQLARRGDLPGTRIGKSWVFLRGDVMAFLRQRIATDTEERRRLSSKAIVASAVPSVRPSRRTTLPILPALPAKRLLEKKP